MWYYLDNQRQSVGPLSREEIAERITSGTIGRNTLVWKQGMADWAPLGKTTELASLAGNAEANVALKTARKPLDPRLLVASIIVTVVSVVMIPVIKELLFGLEPVGDARNPVPEESNPYQDTVEALKANPICNACRGSGSYNVACKHCSGRRTIQTSGGYVIVCPNCSGLGTATARCPSCGGSGKASDWRENIYTPRNRDYEPRERRSLYDN